MQTPTRHTTVSLVLGSGGARGLAHIGVIRWLEENGYDIRAIAGSSMVVVEIPRNACRMFEFDRAAELMELGRQRTAQVLQSRNA